MLKYLLKRSGESLLILFIILTIVFLMLRLMPLEGYLGEGSEKLTEEQKKNILESMGLLDPIPVQLINFYKSLIRGNLGQSLIYRPNVAIATILASKIPYSLCFGVGAFVLSYLIGIPLGVLMAMFRKRTPDRLGTGYIVLINAVPAAVYFLFIQIYVTSALRLPMLFKDDDPRTWILPVMCMSLGGIANHAMWIRRFVADEINEDYVKLAKAKGLSTTQVMYRHVLRNAFVPLAQNLPAGLLMQIAGSIYIESLYSIPGMGGLLVTAIQRQDNTLVQALVLIFSAIGVFGLFLGDLLMVAFDPRIKLVRGGTR